MSYPFTTESRTGSGTGKSGDSATRLRAERGISERLSERLAVENRPVLLEPRGNGVARVGRPSFEPLAALPRRP